ncbi:hypothetical protein A5741_11765 [Mycolicibacterium conceptionense]|uniref:Uncharacterized protein n=2 Tax=Mycobacteriaceae TaxID=1762 RepID=A0ABR5FMJ6_9MYCO|nr:hypothetical protein AA982_04785 [Mycolicibacterium senegalense]KLO47748.1 hypothetical protein ABW05_31805 [Mycolicibacterium senegalense]OMB90694.1 hypothetical protein A5741_11765 [Mycolicibacterium conceptionense]
MTVNPSLHRAALTRRSGPKRRDHSSMATMTNYRVAYVLSGGEPVAVFLDSAADCNPGNLMTYMRVGEHDEGSIEWVREQPPAVEYQYRDLHAYLARRYADPSQGESLELVIDQTGLPR